MSHFIVFVTGNDIENQLAPFNECDDAVLEENAYWDWYEIGGRWDKFLVTKKGEKVNQALKKDIDLKKTFAQAEYDTKAPFALVHNRKWSARATMGFFCMTCDEDKDWGKNFKKLWRKINDDELITAVDCHI